MPREGDGFWREMTFWVTLPYYWAVWWWKNRS